jgi:hypothetical protein
MEPETVRAIVVAGVLILAPLYGYWIGTVGKRRSWSAGKFGQVLSPTAIFAAFFAREGLDIDQAPKWVRIAVVAAVVTYTFLTAFFSAAKSSGIPLRTLLFARDELGNELKGKSDLSIR